MKGRDKERCPADRGIKRCLCVMPPESVDQNIFCCFIYFLCWSSQLANLLDVVFCYHRYFFCLQARFLRWSLKNGLKEKEHTSIWSRTQTFKWMFSLRRCPDVWPPWPSFILGWSVVSYHLHMHTAVEIIFFLNQHPKVTCAGCVSVLIRNHQRDVSLTFMNIKTGCGVYRTSVICPCGRRKCYLWALSLEYLNFCYTENKIFSSVAPEHKDSFDLMSPCVILQRMPDRWEWQSISTDNFNLV